jgi:GWxTD domain-containing protein
MKLPRTRLTTGVLAVLVLSLAAAAAGDSQKAEKPKLPETYGKWLNDEVADIIAPMEREVFLKLRTDRERDLFIEAFWKQRDPSPGSPENEAKTEHYRRIAHADRFYGRDALRPGHRTDRGRIFIILGEPRDTQRFEGKGETYDTEVWFYQGKTDLGLPAGFNVVFFKEGGLGEFKLYSPTSDGPQALIAGWTGGPDYTTAYKKLQRLEPDLAAVSLSLVPGQNDGLSGRPSLASDILIQRIETSPARSVEANYARKFLEYKDLIEVEYTANYLDSDSLVKVFLDPAGFYFVHYTVEPRRLSVNQSGDTFDTTLKVNGRVTARDGRLVYQFDKTVPITLTAEEMKSASQTPFDFQDLFPLVAGDYNLSVLIKNEVSKEFTSVEQTLRIPEAGAAVALTRPLLGYRAVKLDPAAAVKVKAFRLGQYQIYGQPGRVFTRQDTMVLAFQVNDATEAVRAGGELHIEFLKDGQPLRDIRRKHVDYADPRNVLEEVPLAEFAPAHYTVRVSYLSGGMELVSTSEEFDLTFAESVPRPWLSSRLLPDAGDPVYQVMLGSQLFNLGRAAEARVFLERAFARDPASEETAAGLARVSLALGDSASATRALAAFVDPQRSPEYETLVLAAEAQKRAEEFETAAGLLERAIAHYGVNVVLLNAIGECHEGLGKPGEALAAYEKSLQLSPDQPEIRKRVEALKKKAPLCAPDGEDDRFSAHRDISFKQRAGRSLNETPRAISRPVNER